MISPNVYVILIENVVQIGGGVTYLDYSRGLIPSQVYGFWLNVGMPDMGLMFNEIQPETMNINMNHWFQADCRNEIGEKDMDRNDLAN